jgi:hypothetical protein
MDPVHLHLALNHVPVVGLAFGLLLLAASMIWRNDETQRFALGMFVLVALVALVVYATGEPTEEAVEHLPGVTDAVIDQHKQAATIGLIGAELVGAVSLLGLLVFARTRVRFPRWFVVVVLVLALAGQALMVWAGNTGGQIRHGEIRAGAPSGGATSPTSEERKD